MSRVSIPMKAEDRPRVGPIRKEKDADRKTGEISPNSHEPFVLRLYITGRAPNSILALANLDRLCEEYRAERFQVDVIDILEYPLRAIADEILVSPTLLKVSPSPSARLVGNLSEIDKVLDMLGLEKKDKWIDPTSLDF